MLDYFLKKGIISLDKDNNPVKTEKCPSYLHFEENRDGVIIFYITKSDGTKRGISDIEDWEFIETVK